MAVTQALCLNVDQKQAAENPDYGHEPPASPLPTEPSLQELQVNAGNMGSKLRFATIGWEFTAAEVFFFVLLCFCFLFFFVMHSTTCTASFSRCSWASPILQFRLKPGVHCPWHPDLFAHLVSVAGPHNPSLLFHSAHRWFSMREGNNATNGNISTSPNKNKS